jgi:hypothetical protein
MTLSRFAVSIASMGSHDLRTRQERDPRRELRGAVHQRRDREHRHRWSAGSALGNFLRTGHRGSGGVGTAHAGVEDVPVPPHHALGHARGAAGVDDVDVVR